MGKYKSYSSFELLDKPQAMGRLGNIAGSTVQPAAPDDRPNNAVAEKSAGQKGEFLTDSLPDGAKIIEPILKGVIDALRVPQVNIAPTPKSGGNNGP